MRKRLIVALLIVFLSVAPVFAGHSVAGGFGWCECDNPGSHTQGLTIENDNEEFQQNSAPELGLLVLFLTALMLRYKA